MRYNQHVAKQAVAEFYFVDKERSLVVEENPLVFWLDVAYSYKYTHSEYYIGRDEVMAGKTVKNYWTTFKIIEDWTKKLPKTKDEAEEMNKETFLQRMYQVHGFISTYMKHVKGTDKCSEEGLAARIVLSQLLSTVDIFCTNGDEGRRSELTEDGKLLTEDFKHALTILLNCGTANFDDCVGSMMHYYVGGVMSANPIPIGDALLYGTAALAVLESAFGWAWAKSTLDFLSLPKISGVFLFVDFMLTPANGINAWSDTESKKKERYNLKKMCDNEVDGIVVMRKKLLEMMKNYKCS